MDASARLLRVPSALNTGLYSRSSWEHGNAAAFDYVLSERIALPPLATASHGGWLTLLSNLKSIASKHAQFYQSIAPCALASCTDTCGNPKSVAPSHNTGASRSHRERFTSTGPTEGVVGSVSLRTSTAPNAPPDLESLWSATSPMPPTAVLAALYSLLPLRHVSVHEDAAGNAAARNVSHELSLLSAELEWTLCRSTELRGSRDGWRISFWEAFALTAVAAHKAAGTAIQDAPLDSASTSSSSASSFSMEQQLRRSSATLRSQSESSTATPTPAVGVLEWPEELLWNLLVSLLSVLALVHNAGLHFHGQLTAADVLCLSCASSLPRLLEETWQGVLVVAATRSTKAVSDDGDSVALFRRFYATAAPSVLLPHALLTAETPCHNAFFVVQPSLALLSRHQQTEAGCATFQDVAGETPEQLARFQAADLASVGRLLSFILEMRAQWSSEESRRFSTSGGAAPQPASAHPSSELVFLVRRLCECETAAASAAATASALRGCPTALQLLQLQALRLRTETWYYRRLSAEAYDQLAHLQQEPARGTTDNVAKAHGASDDGRNTNREMELQAREVAVAERERKLDLILRVYELTHEHLDAVPLPSTQALADNDQYKGGSDVGPHRAIVTAPPHSSTPQDDSLEALLETPSYRQAAATTAAPEGEKGRKAPLTNVSHRHQHHHHHQQQPSDESAGGALETSGDALLGLSPLLRASSARDADTTLLSAGATPFAPFHTTDGGGPHGDDEGGVTPVKAVQALPWGPSQTHRALGGVGPFSPPSTGGWKSEGDVRPLTAPQPTMGPHQLTHTERAGVGSKIVEESSIWGAPAGVSPSTAHPAPVYRSRESVAEAPRYTPRHADLRGDGHYDTQSPERLTVVEVELDDSGDEPAAEATKRSLGTTQDWLPPSWSARDAQPVSSPHPLPPPPPPPPAPAPARVSTSLSSPPTSITAQELRTPVRAPVLPNMGITDPDGGGGGGSHSKYSSLALLRSPPSARQPATGGARATASHSPSPHSPESYRSSTKPFTTTAAAAAAAAAAHHAAVSSEPPPPRSSRRRSGSRGSSGAQSNGLPSTSAARGGDSGTTIAAASAVAPGAATENGEWARQQLHELQNMQSALRAQQLATPRSRAPPVSAAAAEMKTPELRRTQSPGNTPPLRSSREAASTPRSSSLQVTPPTDAVRISRSPLGADGGGQPASVQGAAWPNGNVATAPLSSRQHYADPWAAPAGTTSPAAVQHSAAMPSGRSTPPSKSADVASRPLGSPRVATAGGVGVATGGQSRPDPRVSSAARPVSARASSRTTTATAAALGAALRTPPRQTISFGVPQGSVRGWEAAVEAVAMQRTPLGHRLAAQGVGSAFRPANTTAAGLGGTLTETRGEAFNTARHRGVSAAAADGGGAATRSARDGGVLRRSGGAGAVSPSVAALPAGHTSTATPANDGKPVHALRSGSSSLSAMELLKRLRASSTAIA